MSPRLAANGTDVEVGSVVLRTPGLEGEVDAYDERAGPQRGAVLTLGPLDDVLADEDALVQVALEVRNAEEVAGTPTNMRGPHDEPLMEIDVPAPTEGFGQFVILRDEAGVFSLHFADGDAGSAHRGVQTRTYRLRRTVPPVRDADGARGILGGIASKVIKVVVFRLADELLERLGRTFASKWEAKRFPARVRTMTVDDYREPSGAVPDWDRLQRGRALLLLHGTMMRSHTEFGRFSPELMGRILRRYEHRVFALDHPTLSVDPTANVIYLLEQLPASCRLELDVLCVSRGGLVARVLTERQAKLPLGDRHIDVRDVVFVGTPNAGTALANTERLGSFVDAFTNLIHLIPDNPVTDVLASVVTIAKMIAVGLFEGLDGLMSMTPGGPFLAELNRGNAPDTRYLAIASDFEPKESGFALWVRDALLDPVFGGNANDLIVPRDGVFAANGHDAFPIADPVVFAPDEATDHSSYFKRDRALQQICNWLQIA